MAATFAKFSSETPLNQRTQTITDVVEGDQIDIKGILGRPARQVKIIPDDATDVITFRLNNRLSLAPSSKTQDNQFINAPVVIWSRGDQFSIFSVSGEEYYFSEEGLDIASIEIDSITFGDSGTSISIVVW